METSADKLRALLYAIGVHLACLGLMYLGLLWNRPSPPVSVAGGVIEATLVMSEPAAASRPTPPRRAEQPQDQAPRVQPRPEPRPQDATEPQQPAPQAPIPDPDVVERERVARLALEQAEAKQREEQEARRRQEQIELDEQRREQAEERQRLEQMQREQAEQLADIRRRREEAEKRRRLEEERLRQLADARARTEREVVPARPSEQPPADRLGNQGTDDSMLGRYQLAIQRVVHDNWSRPDSTRPGLICTLRIVQIPGGEVIQVSVTSPCNADDLTRRSIEAAVLKAQPLPYRGFESVFSRDITFKFRYDG